MDHNYFADLIANAAVQNSSRYFEAGVYHVKVDGAKIFMNRQRRPRAVVECSVINSNNANLPTTSQVSWVVSLDSDSGPGSLKTFICQISGCNETEVTSEVINKFFPAFEMNPEAQPSVAIGLQATVNAFEKPTKSGGVYTKLDWRAFDPETDEAPDFANMPRVGASAAPSAEAFQGAAVASSDPIPF